MIYFVPLTHISLFFHVPCLFVFLFTAVICAFEKIATTPSLYELASHSGRPSPVNLGVAGGGSLEAPKPFLKITLWACAHNFPLKKVYSFFFSGSCNLLLPLVFVVGTGSFLVLK